MTFIMLQWVSLLAIIMYEWTTNRKWNIRFSIYSLLGAVLVIIACFLALYVQWTSHRQGIGIDWVDGVQGRYFIPIAPFIVAAIPSVKLKLLTPKYDTGTIANHITCIVGITSAAATFLILLLRYRV